MSEKSRTPAARRAVAKLIERYFFALKRQLAEQTAAFWARVEAGRETKVRADTINDNKEGNKPVKD
jgi:hypothetical protein